jgi:hypothetical protein
MVACARNRQNLPLEQIATHDVQIVTLVEISEEVGCATMMNAEMGSVAGSSLGEMPRMQRKGDADLTRSQIMLR